MVSLLTSRGANIVTLANLVFGSISLICTINDDFRLAAIFILAAVIMDGIDGRIARRFNSTSEIGRELDSLCDLVSFGVAPAVLLYAQVLAGHTGLVGLLAAVFYIGCGAYRLARFNVLRIEEFFMGIPITLAGALMALLSMGSQSLGFMFTVIALAVVSLLMISRIRIPKL